LKDVTLLDEGNQNMIGENINIFKYDLLGKILFNFLILRKIDFYLQYSKDKETNIIIRLFEMFS
jgi:hypothetical protein